MEDTKEFFAAVLNPARDLEVRLRAHTPEERKDPATIETLIKMGGVAAYVRGICVTLGLAVSATGALSTGGVEGFSKETSKEVGDVGLGLAAAALPLSLLEYGLRARKILKDQKLQDKLDPLN